MKFVTLQLRCSTPSCESCLIKMSEKQPVVWLVLDVKSVFGPGQLIVTFDVCLQSSSSARNASSRVESATDVGESRVHINIFSCICC